MKKLIIIYVLLINIFSSASIISSQESQKAPPQEFIQAQVIKIIKQGVKTDHNLKQPYQIISAQIIEGKDNGKTVTIEGGIHSSLTPSQVVQPGQIVILTKIADASGKTQYQVYDVYRINSLFYLVLVFFIVIIVFSRWKGFTSLLGLCLSLIVIFIYIIPQILNGADPLKTVMVGSLIILVLSTYIAHGFSRQTTIAVLSSFIGLLLTVILSSLFVQIAHLTGFNEGASSLQYGPTNKINIRGLLLGGIIIGTLGALNDLTTTQVAAVFELGSADPKLSISQLLQKGLNVGREHVISMVNTLVLAFAGSSLALFLFIQFNPTNLPYWIIINSEDISDEIIRALAGGMALILTMPIVTMLAVYIYNKQIIQKK